MYSKGMNKPPTSPFLEIDNNYNMKNPASTPSPRDTDSTRRLQLSIEKSEIKERNK
jgi:hypothetical protein